MERSVVVKVKKLSHFDSSFCLPAYESLQAAGADLRVSFPDKESLTLAPGEKALLPTGLSLEIPEGYEVQVRPRSGLSLKTSLMVLNSPGTIDSDYRGELKVILGNLGTNEEVITHGERVAQIVLAPVWRAEFKVWDGELSQTERGTRGFGSTGNL